MKELEECSGRVGWRLTHFWVCKAFDKVRLEFAEVFRGKCEVLFVTVEGSVVKKRTTLLMNFRD